jgi:TonB family protein
LPEPFLDIARHCLLRHPQGRWTVAQIATRLDGRAPVPQVRTMPPQARTPVPAPQPITRNSRPLAKYRKYEVPIAVGFVLVVAAFLVGPRLLRRHSEAPQVPAAADEPPLVPPAPREVAPSPQEHPIKSFKPSVAEEEQSSKAPVPVPASIHPETIHEEEPTVAKLSGGSPVHGGVAHQVMPEVLQSARDTIRGTVRVSVNVNVDRSGNVEDAELESRGPSKYFGRAALQAAQLWKFKPPKVAGQGVLSSWTLQFEFTRDETTVIPIQEMP